MLLVPLPTSVAILDPKPPLPEKPAVTAPVAPPTKRTLRHLLHRRLAAVLYTST